jgi:hypothetical protein
MRDSVPVRWSLYEGNCTSATSRYSYRRFSHKKENETADIAGATMSTSLSPRSLCQAPAASAADIDAQDDYSYEDKCDAFDDFYAHSRPRGSGKTQKAGKPNQQKGLNGIYSSKHVRVKNNERRSKR